MAVKYVKDFVFGPMTSVQHYAKGGHVTKVPAKAKPAAKGMPARAKPNAPAKGAKRMESPPKVGKGQGYKDGGKVPGKQMDRLPTKTPPGRQKDLAPAKPEKGQYQGYNKGGKARRYAEGGDVEDSRAASIRPGDGSPLDAGVRYNQYGEADPYGDRPVRDITLTPYRPPAFDERGLDGPANSLNLREPMPMQDYPSVPLNQYGEADPFEGRGARYEAGPVQQTGTYAPASSDSAAYQALFSGRTMPYQPEPTRAYDPGVVQPEPMLPASFGVDGPGRMSGDMLYKWDDGTYHYRQQLFPGQEEEGYNPDYLSGDYYRNLSREALAAKSEPAMARAVRNVGAGSNVGLSDLMRAARPQDMMRRPGMPQVNMYAKGGQVKGQSKVGKVMGEYKKGELHSGSKKGPLVKNPKQAVAIALSEARKAGAKIPKKADGGPLSDKELGGKSYAGRNEPLRGKYVSREEKIMREAMAKEKQKDMERKMREAYERTQSQSVSGLKKGGMARKAVPTHKAKAMYGGGKC